jgi:transposase-like protein
MKVKCPYCKKEVLLPEDIKYQPDGKYRFKCKKCRKSFSILLQRIIKIITEKITSTACK